MQRVQAAVQNSEPADKVAVAAARDAAELMQSDAERENLAGPCTRKLRGASHRAHPIDARCT